MDEGSLGARRCLEAVSLITIERSPTAKPLGWGLGLKNSGLGNGFREVSRSVVRFLPDGKVEVRHCWTEMGQGVHTVALQVAVEELGIDPDRIEVRVDTSPRTGGRADHRITGHPDGGRFGGRCLPQGARRRL